MTKEIKLTQWKVALVDDEDFDELNKYKWCLWQRWKYAWRWIWNKDTGKQVWIRMHSFIMKTPEWMLTDHIDWDWLNNQKSNLRVCTAAQNQMNRGKSSLNTSWYKWVVWHKNIKKWAAKIRVRWAIKYLGYFTNKIDAYSAYCEAAKKYHWEFAHF
jgi:hypothetical protein